MFKVFVQTLGCKLNFAESSTLEQQLKQKGYVTSCTEKDCDFFVLNTCSVTENADKNCQKIVRRVKKSNPHSKIIVVGCYAQLKPKEIMNINEVDMVLGAKEKFNIDKFLHKLIDSNSSTAICTPINEVSSFVPSYSFGNRTRTFFKVQDGCDYSCTFCTIPMARGQSRSDTLDNTIERFKKVLSKGVREIVLTGVNIGDIGLVNQVKEYDFLDLIHRIDDIKGDFRIRISSIEPNLLNEDIISFVANSIHFLPHFHIPLQSGSDDILKKMRRRYLTQTYKEKIELIKKKIPDCCIGIDVIVGFPTESDKHFEETYQFLSALDFTYLHIFTYSERDNTPAIKLGEKVSQATKNERRIRLEKLSNMKKERFYISNLNQKHEVLFEKDVRENYLQGYTKNYIKVQHPFNELMINQVKTMRLNDVTLDLKMQGEILSKNI